MGAVSIVVDATAGELSQPSSQSADSPGRVGGTAQSTAVLLGHERAHADSTAESSSPQSLDPTSRGSSREAKCCQEDDQGGGSKALSEQWLAEIPIFDLEQLASSSCELQSQSMEQSKHAEPNGR